MATPVIIDGAPVIVAVAEQARGRRALGRADVIILATALGGSGLLVGLPGGGYRLSATGIPGAAMLLVAVARFVRGS